jgi:hypothetical protein
VVAGGSRQFEILGNGRTTIYAGGLAVSGGASVQDTGCTIADGGLAVAALTDVNVLDVNAPLGTFSSTLILGRADRPASTFFYLQKLTSGGANMFTVRCVAERAYVNVENGYLGIYLCSIN